MIKNFDEIKGQLRELAEVVNKFSSEAVQLRIVELVFGEYEVAFPPEDATEDIKVPPKKTKRRAKPKAVKPPAADGAKKKPTSVGNGPTATLVKLSEGDFFNSPQSMKSIIEYCEVNLARKIKQNDISGKLARMVRDGTLKRAKNADGQYEYSKS